jgi:hypothetical protein
VFYVKDAKIKRTKRTFNKTHCCCCGCGSLQGIVSHGSIKQETIISKHQDEHNYTCTTQQLSTTSTHPSSSLHPTQQQHQSSSFSSIPSQHKKQQNVSNNKGNFQNRKTQTIHNNILPL